MRISSTLIICFVTLSAFAQRGDFLLTEHFPRHSNIDNSNFEIINDHKGRICVANRSGVLKYDGDAWDYYETPSAALSLAVDSSDVVYVGCIGSVGRIDFEERKVIYKPLIETETLNDLFLETVFLRNKVFFLGSKNLIVYDTKKEESTVYTGDFLNMYVLDAELFINTIDNETLLVYDSMQTINPKKQIAYANKKTGKPDLVIDFQGAIFSYSNFEFKSLPQNSLLNDRGYEVQEIQWINDSLFVCSTFESGLLFFNTNKPNEITVTDYHSGLPDNEVYALHTDNTNSVWAAHEFGITQISPLFPAYSYSHFPGLNGNLTSVSYLKNKLWVTTSLGLYYFDQDTIFENKVYYEVESTRKKKTTTTNKTTEESENKPLLKRLFGKKQRATNTDQEEKKSKGIFKAITDIFDGDNKVDQVKGKLDKNAKYVRKVRKVPVDVKYSFKKIEGANGKFLSVLSYRNKLLAVSTSGVYEIKNNEAEIIILENIRSFTINRQQQLVLSTSDQEVAFYKLIQDVWVQQISQTTDDIIVNLKEDNDGNMWLAGSNSIYKAKSTDSTFTVLSKYKLNNLFLDEVSLMERAEKLYFINSQGYFYYDPSSDEVVEDTALKQSIGTPVNHQFDIQSKSVWCFTGKFWYQLSGDGSTKAFEYLGLFPDLRGINSSHNSSHLWILTQENDILKYDPSKNNDIGQINFFLRKVSNEKGEIDQTKKFKLNYDENFLRVELSKPDFLGLLNPEFQYKLEGRHQEWSEWTQNKSIDFSFLPEGNYRLLVRSRDAFGRVEEGEVLEFSVKPPYWQTPWFYAIQILFFGGLVYFSSKLNQDSSKNRLLKSGLTLLTLVLIIEFLQSAIGSLFTFKSTPVIDFLIDAMIAFMIFPLERLLRDIMTKGKVKVKVNIKKEDLQLIKKDSPSK